MFDLSKEFQSFYDMEVKLAQSEVSKLREKKKINIERLQAGLKEYNEEHKTDYKIVQTIEQGSVAMSTIIKNKDMDYDIDVAIIFEKENISNIGPNAIQNIIIDALKRKCTNMKTPPYSKTNCIRIEYADNYHIDFAIYRREKSYNDEFVYEHAGSEWRERNPYAINNWFKDEINQQGYNLRKVIRLSKMFCKSRDSWDMPGGLIQTVLCSDEFVKKDRIDETFYYTLTKVRDRLAYNKNVFNPTNNQSLILTEDHKNKVDNLYNRLNNYINKLSVLFEKDCTYEKACNAWYEFFNNEYWKSDIQNQSNNIVCDDTEEYIKNMFPILNTNKYIKLDCRLRDSNRQKPDRLLSNILSKNEKIDIGYILDFYIENTNVSRPYEIYWKVKNNGGEAMRLNDLRGEIFKSFSANDHHSEYSKFKGNHYVECYIIKNKVCVAIGRIEVPIE